MQLNLSEVSADSSTSYLTGAGGERGDWRDVQNLQLVHVPVQDDGGSVHVSAPGRRVRLREVVIDELADDRSFAHPGSTDHRDTQRLHHHPCSAASAPWTATAAEADVSHTRGRARAHTRRERDAAAAAAPVLQPCSLEVFHTFHQNRNPIRSKGNFSLRVKSPQAVRNHAPPSLPSSSAR